MTETYNLTIIHYTSPSFIGGVETLIGDFLALSSEQGYKIKLIVGKGSSYRSPEVEVIHIPLLDANSSEITDANKLLLKGKLTPEVVRLCNEIYVELSKYIQPKEIIHAHNVITNSYNLPLVVALHRIMSTKDNIGMLAWCHDIAWGKSVTQHHDFSIYPSNLLTTVWPRTHYLVLSQKRKSEIQVAMNISDQQISLIPPYINLQRIINFSSRVKKLFTSFGILESDIILFYPCRVTRRKNIELALKITGCLKKMEKSVRLLITAPVSPHRTSESEVYRKEIMDMIKELNIVSEVILLGSGEDLQESNGYFSKEDIAGLYRVADLVLSTSCEEGFGLSNAESILAGTPILINSETAMEFRNCDLVNTFSSEEEPSIIAKKALRVAEQNQCRKQFYKRYTSGPAYWDKIVQLSMNISTSL